MKYHHGNLRVELVKCAENLCKKHGYEKLSLRAIAKEANVSQTAPYRHFKTKNDLLAEVAKSGFNELKSGIDNILRESDAKKLSQSTLMKCMFHYMHFASSQKNIYDIMFGTVLSDFALYPELSNAADQTFTSLNEILRRYKNYDESELRSKSIKIWAFLHGLVGLNQIEQSRSKQIKQTRAVSNLREAKSNLDIFLTESINSLLN